MNQIKITAFRIKEASKNSHSRREMLHKMGVSSTSNNYSRLAKVANENDIIFPPLRKIGSGRSIQPKRRTQRVWDENLIRSLALQCTSKRQILIKLGLKSRDTRKLNKIAEEFRIVLPHGNESCDARTKGNIKIPLKLLVLGNPGDPRVEGRVLKRIVIINGLLKDECALCKLSGNWNNKPIILQIDHINGNAVDNRIENLRILCPNCHSQTDSFGGRNKGKGTARRIRTQV